MTAYDFDVVIIGSGPGGYVAAIRAAQLGLKTACVEKSPTLGGTCLNVGCIPSKALLQSTEHLQWWNNSAKEHGIEAASVTFDFNKLMLRKENIVKNLVEGIASHFKRHGIARLNGQAHFVNPHVIEIVLGQETRKISAKYFVIATGSAPIQLPFLPFNEQTIVSSTGCLSLNTVPKSLLVIGAGAIGLELASVYRRLGTSITIVEMLDEIVPTSDKAITRLLLQSLKKQGIEFLLGAKVIAASQVSNGIQLTVEYEKQTLTLSANVVLVAIGRKPYTEGLQLQNAGLKVDPKGFIPVDANYKSAQPHILAIGDVIEGPMLAHRATHEGIAAIEIIAGKQPHLNYMGIPNVIYTHPEAASVGLTEEEARNANIDVMIGTSYFRANPRARCNGDIEGMVKVIGQKGSGRIIGMHIIGAQASELIAQGMIVIDKQGTLEDLANACFAHPTLSETVMEACQQALGWAIHGV